MKSITKITIVIPNWNGRETISTCLESLQNQTITTEIVVVENGSTDDSLKLLQETFSDITVLPQKNNLGFAGGVNKGISYALHKHADYIALFNNDAIAEKDWLEHLVKTMQANPEVGIVTSKIVDQEKKHFDSTGDMYTHWGLPYPRGRGNRVSAKYDKDTEIFSASGGASLYRATMLKKIGLFDESFFAYYEDVDISFRAQLAGWKVRYEPEALVYHQIGATSKKIKGFTTIQTMKNLPLLLWKNVPTSLLPIVVPRFLLAYCGFFISAYQRGQLAYAFEGFIQMLFLLPSKTLDRWHNLTNRAVPTSYIRSILTYDLPPNAKKLRALRTKWHNQFKSHA